MSKYTHLSLKERKQICIFIEMGYSIAKIAQRLNRHRSTIYEEIKRNGVDGRYFPYKAHEVSKSRYKGRAMKLKQDRKLFDYVTRRLKQGWSPEQIAGRMKREKKLFYACHETIYQYIYKSRSKKLYSYLTYKKACRGRRLGRKKGSGKYLHIRPISDRPSEVENRKNLGHWEADTIGFNTSKYENVSTLVERKARFTIMIKNTSRKSKEVMSRIKERVDRSPRKMWKTLTFDQGSEFADFRSIDRNTHCTTYFCQPHSPWQRGSNENMNGRIRRYLPRSIKIQRITQVMVDEVCKKLNNTPRKCLGFMTPKEALKQDCTSYCRALS